ncbi:hypothetical protein HYH03_010263 [Edaphochlamys debaryana]|uniref:HotDog ACOT-type domain-containing protein n=1 Tax=Edaphochlamys debaryana TaxID=47281 RepID=A0A835XWG2_9CHLO|nr:hypothetical protein HYH03_010263 [Edaphochlamys debaryana]|eukprot:KAG2491478.1 hypothetical protein HYH03_010263 [Edaphochlamys debaryana]
MVEAADGNEGTAEGDGSDVVESKRRDTALQAEVLELRERVAKLETMLQAVLAGTASGTQTAAAPPAAPLAPSAPSASFAPSTSSASAASLPPPAPSPPPPRPLPPPSPLPPAAMPTTRVVMHQLVLPADVNQLGICTGGQVLSWIDLAAGLSAKTLAHGPCVTASVDAVHFLRPCRLGCVVIVAAMVARTFNTSMEVAVVVESEDMRSGVRHHCCSAHLTFVVRPHAGGGGSGLPRVYPITPEHRAVWEGAEVRRQQRLERRMRTRQDPALKDAERVCRLQPITHREGGPTLPPALTLTPAQQRELAASPSASPSPAGPLSRQTSATPLQAFPFPVPPRAASPAPAVAAASAGDSTPEPSASAAGPVPDPGNPVSLLQPPSEPAMARTVTAFASLRQLVPPGCTTSYMTQSILPQHANTLNITFGGQVMSWMEQCAYISASRLRAPGLLTAAMDSVSFVRPTRVGDILYVTAQVSAIFGSSLEVMVSVFGESPYAGAGSSAAGADASGGGAGPTAGGTSGSGQIFHCADAYVTVVAVDERHGSPVQVPFELDPRDQPDVLRYQGALARRAERLALRGQFAAGEASRVSLDGGHTYSPPGELAETGSVLDGIPPL